MTLSNSELLDILNDLVRDTSPYDTTDNSGGTAVNRAAQAIQALINKQVIEARIDGRITGLKSASRYKGNGFEVSQKIYKEIDRLNTLKDNLKDKGGE